MPRERRWEPRRLIEAPNSAPVIASAAARLSPSTRCPYTSLVIANARMAEDLGDYMQWRALGEHQRGTGVPQLVRMLAVIRGYMKLARTCPYAVRNVQRGGLIRIRSGHQRCRQRWRRQPHGEGQRQGAGPCRGSAARRPWHAKHPGR